MNENIGLLLTTMPKSGTHLLRQLIEKVTGRVSVGLKAKVADISSIDSYRALRHGHLRMGRVRGHHEKWLTLVLIRDPRDVVLSMRDYLAVSENSRHKAAYGTIASLPSDEQLKAVIDGIRIEGFGVKPIAMHCRGWIEWSIFGAAIFRYEGIVLGETKRLARVLDCDEGVVSDALSSIVGRRKEGTVNTLNKGIPARWRSEMSKDVLDHFYAQAGYCLSYLGYGK